MNTRRRRLATSLGLAAVLIVTGTVTTIDRVPGGGALHAQQTSWRGLFVAPERRCTPYDADERRASGQRAMVACGGAGGDGGGAEPSADTCADAPAFTSRRDPT